MTQSEWEQKFIADYHEPGVPWIVDTVLLGLVEGLDKCCIEFFARCRVVGDSPFQHGGKAMPGADGLVLCPVCAAEWRSDGRKGVA